MARWYFTSITAGVNLDFNDYINKKEASLLNVLVVITLQVAS